ncbi:uncharacterized protein LOC114946580 isoform X2 [Nylanderia fulva]|uniref:uncharacterized protein LOC114946580 isoform X2 n=1 Tax=Nylanderia fulva TaxID=613905 RepID=UPI0010FB7DAE|nr:uncharacterized protein LOC114946580 isoform X2 [Nylanderia fulva]
MASRNKADLLELQVECDDDYNRNNNNHGNSYADCSANVAGKEEDLCAKRNHQSNHHQPRKAPLVGWRNGSPTICLTNSVVHKNVDLVDSVNNRREVGLDSTEKSNNGIKLTEQSATPRKIEETLDRESSNADTPTNQVRDSLDSESISSEREDSLGSIEKMTKSRKKPKVPDGGWGWVVVLASLVISMIADGVSFSFGLLYIEFLHEFGASKSKTAWIGSLFMAVPLLSGPIMSALVDRYGCRNMTIIGGLVSGFGFILSIFSNTIEVMYLTFGVIAGLGLGLCYVTAVVSIAFWFDKKRTLAVGLGACGTGIGTFVYAPMTTYFINEYGWRGACLLLAGTFFNMIVAGTVMRDPEWWILEQQKQDQAATKKSNVRSDGTVKSNGSPSDEFPGVEELRRLLRSDRAPEYFLQNLSTSIEMADGAKRHTTSVVNLPTFVKRSEKVPLEVLESLLGNSRLYTVILENYPSLLLCRSLSDKHLQDSTGEIHNKSGVTMSMRLKRATESKTIVDQRNKDTCLASTPAPTKLCSRKMSKKEIEGTNPLLAKEVTHTTVVPTERRRSVSKRYVEVESQANVIRTDSIPWLRRQFSTNTHYFKDIRVHRNSVMYRGAALNLHKYRLRASSCPDIYRNSMITLAKENEQLSLSYAEVVRRAGGSVKEHVGLFDVSRIAFPADVIVDDIAIHVVHRTVLLPRGASD